MKSMEWFLLSLNWACSRRGISSSHIQLLNWFTWRVESPRGGKFPWEQPQELGGWQWIKNSCKVFVTNPISRWGLFSPSLNLGWPWDYLTNRNNHQSGCDTMLVLGLDLKRTSNFCFLPTECFLLRSIYHEKKSKLAKWKDHLGRQRHQPPSWLGQGTRYRSKAILAFLVPAPIWLQAHEHPGQYSQNSSASPCEK